MNPPAVEFAVPMLGFAAAFPKIALHRAGSGRALLFPNDPDIIAIATEEDELACDPGCLPRLSIKDPVAIAEFILNHIGRGRRPKPDVAR